MTPVAVTLQQPSSLHVIVRRPKADAAIPPSIPETIGDRHASVATGSR